MPELPSASIRRQVIVPLRFVDGYTTRARVLTFDGLIDGLEHLALGLGAVRRNVSADRFARDRAAPGPAAQRVPHRRRLRQPTLRLRCAAPRSRRTDCRSWRLSAVPAAGRARHRPVQQARRLPPAGRRPRHLRSQPRARPRRGRAGLHGGRADAGGPAGAKGGPAQQQSGQGRAAHPARRNRGGPGADGGALVRDQCRLPGDEGLARRTHAPPHPQRAANRGKRRGTPRRSGAAGRSSTTDDDADAGPAPRNGAKP